VQFSTETRRIPAASYRFLQVKGGKFTVWDGTPAQKAAG
jgi:hypothetical protein